MKKYGGKEMGGGSDIVTRGAITKLTTQQEKSIPPLVILVFQ